MHIYFAGPLPRLLFPCLLLGLCLAAVPARQGRGQGLDYVKAHYTKYEYRIPMRDGKRLFTAVYAPRTKRPAIRSC